MNVPSGIDAGVKVISDIGLLLNDVIDIVKKGPAIGSISKIFDAFSTVKDIVAQAPLALPELKHLNASEVSELTGAAYIMVKSLVANIEGNIG